MRVYRCSIIKRVVAGATLTAVKFEASRVHAQHLCIRGNSASSQWPFGAFPSLGVLLAGYSTSMSTTLGFFTVFPFVALPGRELSGVLHCAQL